VRAVLAVAAALICAALPLSVRAEDPRAISLVDQRGDPFALSQLHGHPSLVTFVASRCTDACPIADGMFLALEKKLRADHVRATLVTITLDPDYDTPYVMAGYAHRFDANPAEWRFASGRPADVRRLMRSFGVLAQKDKNGVADIHTTFVYVLDSHVRLAKQLLLSSNLTQEAEQALKDSAVNK